MKYLYIIALLALAGCATVTEEQRYLNEALDAEAFDTFVAFSKSCLAQGGTVSLPIRSTTRIRRRPYREELAFARCVRL